MKPIFFKSALEFRQWLAKHHLTEKECYVGFYKVKTRQLTLSWSDSVDQALCYGWIDGIRKSIDEDSYQIRFTPRKANSIWSAVNLKKVDQLKAQGLMEKEGLAIYEKRKEAQSNLYSFEQKTIDLPAGYVAIFQKNKKAWTWFETTAPSYKKASIWWVISAKQEATRLKRLDILINCSEQALKIPVGRR
jgi:uncharacterized protein YdeI (YjbR/CyaY-like superfamily)